MQSAQTKRTSLTKPEEINRDHKVEDFSCTKESLDDWLKRRALKSHLAKDSRVFVVCNEANEVVGYYAICAASVARDEAISKLSRNAPDPIPMALIARLAIRDDMQGQGIGPSLLRDAILRVSQASEHIGIKGILVHALDDDAASFYLHEGFHPSSIDDKVLMVQLAEVATELSNPPDP